MNEYQWNDIYIGLSEQFSVSITEKMLLDFQTITGDCNPLHTNKSYANEHGYSECVVYGMLTSSFVSTLGGMYLPGKNCLIQSLECKFLKPVFVGDILLISGTVVEMHESVKQIEIKVMIKNQENVTVLRGKLKVGVLNE